MHDARDSLSLHAQRMVGGIITSGLRKTPESLPTDKLLELLTSFKWPRTRGLKAVCRYKDEDHEVGTTSLQWTRPLPSGFEWIEAYFARLGETHEPG